MSEQGKTSSALTQAAVPSPGAEAAARCPFPQTRAIEIRLQAGFENCDAPRLMRLVKRAGFNTVLLSCFRSGYTLHRSATMREYGFAEQDPLFARTDPIEAVLAAARDVGLRVYALVECLAVGDERGGRGPILRSRPQWAVRNRRAAAASSDPPYLCPVNREVGRFLGDLLCEIVEAWPFHGFYLRHLHFPIEPADRRADYCCCDFCRRSVWQSLGVRIDEIPDDPEHPDRYNLTSWRAKQLARLIRYLRLRVAKAFVRLPTMVEVYLGESDGPPQTVGYQDACVWSEQRLVPMAAVRRPATQEVTEGWLKRVVALSHCGLVLPVLSASPDGALIETIERLASEPLAGFVVCEPHDLTAPPLIKLAGGPWRNEAIAVEANPLGSICGLLAATIDLLPEDNAVRAFLSDALRVFEPTARSWPASQRRALFENLLGLEERIAADRLDLGGVSPEVVRNFRLARHLLRLPEVEP